MSQIDSPGALPLASRDAERRGRRYAQAVERAEALRRAEIKVAQDRLIASAGRLWVRLAGRLKHYVPADTPRVLTPTS